MKVLMFLLVLIPASFIDAQKIGMLAPDKAPEIFPPHSWGMDLMFGDGGFGLGTFYRYSFTQDLTAFVDISISETKDEREFQYYDPYTGDTYTPDKVNRSFLLPLNLGIQYRLFAKSLTDNLRPYINAGIGPTFVVATPYDQEFFSSFKYATIHYGAGGYIGLGANIGANKNNLVGLNVRYYFTHLFDNGIENLTNDFRKDFGQFAITLNIGIMY